MSVSYSSAISCSAPPTMRYSYVPFVSTFVASASPTAFASAAAPSSVSVVSTRTFFIMYLLTSPADAVLPLAESYMMNRTFSVISSAMMCSKSVTKASSAMLSLLFVVYLNSLAVRHDGVDIVRQNHTSESSCHVCADCFGCRVDVDIDLLDFLGCLHAR